MKIFTALKQVEFVLKLFSAAGFNGLASAMETKNENALKEFIAAQATAPIEKIVEKVIEPTDAQLETLLTAELREHIVAAGFTLAPTADPVAALKSGLAVHSALTAELGTYRAALAAAGIKVVAADAAKGPTQAELLAAIDTRVSLKAAELSAQVGTRPVETTVPAVAGATAAAAAATGQDSSLTGLARVEAALRAGRK